MVVLDREFGSKTGSGGVASAQQEAIDRRERLRRLALETIDLAKDPYLMRNHLGQYECKLCLTLHTNEGNYLAHTQVGARWRGYRANLFTLFDIQRILCDILKDIYTYSVDASFAG